MRHRLTPRQQRLHNLFQALLLVSAMALLCGYLAWLIGGTPLMLAALSAVLVAYFFNPAVSPRLILKLYHGRLIQPEEAPHLSALVHTLAQRAGLARPPRLYYIPSDVLNAFSTGSRDEAVVALSNGVLRQLSLREITAILGHELSHIQGNDIRIMGFADLVSRLTGLFSLAGQFLLLLNLPLLLFTGYHLAWTPIFILLLAPTASTLIQLALSRTREYNADLHATLLTGDPEGLASALQRMELSQGHILEQMLFPGQRLPEPSLLRSHPPTEERIARLLALRADPIWRAESWPSILEPSEQVLYQRLSQTPLPPRRRRSGLWY
jgi:heat shock protein HtpX